MLACNAAFGVVRPKDKRIALYNKLSGAFLRDVSFKDFGLLGLDAQSLVDNIKLKVIAAKALPHERLSFRCIKLTCPDLGLSSTRVDVMYDEGLAHKVLEECLEAQIHESLDLNWDEDNTNHTKCSIDSIRVVLSASQPSLLPEVLLAESAKRVKVVGYGIDDKPGVSLVAKLRPAELYMENMTIDDVLSIIPIVSLQNVVVATCQQIVPQEIVLFEACCSPKILSSQTFASQTCSSFSSSRASSSSSSRASSSSSSSSSSSL